jgi:hypothetical protein
MGNRRVELLAKRFPSGISSTTYLPPIHFACSHNETVVLFWIWGLRHSLQGGRARVGVILLYLLRLYWYLLTYVNVLMSWAHAVLGRGSRGTGDKG